MDSFKIPMRFRNGDVEKVVDGTDDYYAQLLALTIQILPGELPLTPQYGVADPVFDEEAKEQLAFIAAAFIPEIILDSVDIEDDPSGRSRIVIAFSQGALL
jgi:hypothetical protein